MNTFNKNSHNQIKDQHNDVLTWLNPYGETSMAPTNTTTWSSLLMKKKKYYKEILQESFSQSIIGK
jgi:hypothetical protein